MAVLTEEGKKAYEALSRETKALLGAYDDYWKKLKPDEKLASFKEWADSKGKDVQGYSEDVFNKAEAFYQTYVPENIQKLMKEGAEKAGEAYKALMEGDGEKPGILNQVGDWAKNLWTKAKENPIVSVVGVGGGLLGALLFGDSGIVGWLLAGGFAVASAALTAYLVAPEEGHGPSKAEVPGKAKEEEGKAEGASLKRGAGEMKQAGMEIPTQAPYTPPVPKNTLPGVSEGRTA